MKLALVIASPFLLVLVIAACTAVVNATRRKRALKHGPAERRRPDFDLFDEIIPCAPGDHEPSILVGRETYCGVCGYEVRS